MDKIWQKISSMFLALAMTVTMTHKARAEGGEAAPPDPAPQAVTEPEGDALETVSAPEEGDPSGEDDPAEYEDIPAEGEDDPAEDEEDPTEDEDVPAEDEDDPAEDENVPAEDGDDPAEDEEDPAESEDDPAEDEDDSAEGEDDPAEDEDDPAEDEDAPAEDEDAPAEDEDDPAEDEDAPAEDEDDPAEDGDAPAEDGDAPAEDEDVPAGEEDAAPDEEQPAPRTRGAVFVMRSAGPSGVLRAGGSGDPDAGTDGTGAAGDIAEGDPGASAAAELVLCGDMGVQEVQSDTDIVIKTAGLQQIGSLVSDGDVYIVGTGILLVDEVSLLQGCSVYLQSLEDIYGENGGTVGLFLLIDEKDGIKTYELINTAYQDDDGEHVVSAILDEEYTLPGDINLVVPDGGAVVMQCVNTIVETVMGENGETETNVYRSTTGQPETGYSVLKPPGNVQLQFIESAPVLNVPVGSTLTVQAGASFLLTHLFEIGIGQDKNSSLINVSGKLVMDGDLTGGSIDIKETGELTGSGTFVNPDRVTVRSASEIATINAEDAIVYFPEEVSVGSLNVDGSSDVIFDKGLNVDSMTVNYGDLRIHNRTIGEAGDITVSGTVSGNGTIDLFAGNILLSGGSQACSVPIDTGINLSYAHSASEGILRYDADAGSLQKAPLIPLVGETYLEDGRIGIPVANADVLHTTHVQPFGTSSKYEGLAAAVDTNNNPLVYSCEAAAELSYEVIDGVLGGSARKGSYILETCANGSYGYLLLSPGSEEAADAASVVQIICLTENGAHEGTGGGTLTSTDTAYTGSGILGTNAGSASGGTKRLALTGNREPDDPADDPEKETDPEQAAGKVRIWTEKAPEAGCFELHIEVRGVPVTRLSAPARVRMAFADWTEEKPVYAVFRDAEGNLRAFLTQYDPAAGILSFSSDMAGKFVIVAFDFDGEPFTEAFYEALAKLDAVAALPA